jgi:nitronate monooxygenase
MQLGIAEEPVVNNTHNIKLQNNFFELVDILLAENIQVISFTFGNLPAEIIQTFKTNGAYLIGTATCLAEAKLLADSGIDAIVAQGYEAGGHRGNFINKASQTSIATMALVPQLVSHIDRPVIAAGGIMDGRGIVAALALGASAVQMGTAFLTTVESGCHPAYKAALLKAKNSDVDTTTLTKVYSGKTVRGLHNHFIEHMEEKRVDIPPYPIANALTSPIRKAAAQQQARDIMSIWSGQGVSLVTEQLSVQGLLTKLNTEVKENLQQLVTTFGKMES